MLSYQHGYHAGGFADVHKHVALCLLLSHLGRKPAPYCVIDTHAGRGIYDLTGVQASRTGEWQAGIAKLVAAAPADPALRSYLDLVAGFNRAGGLTVYPGSPGIATRLMRRTDRLIAIEAHPAEHEALADEFHHDRRVHIHRRDSFEALPGLVPPAERRGLVLIDPSYEVKTEYRTIPQLVAAALRRWSAGIFAVWYPLLPDDRHLVLLDGLETLERPMLTAELAGPDRGQGLRGTGIAVINPPWQFAETLAAAGSEIAAHLFGIAGKHVMNLTGEPS